jgi:hypothetical protein
MRKSRDPQTPDKYQKISKRSWDFLVRKWRRQLHHFDPRPTKDSEQLNLQEEANTLDDE